MVFYNSNPDCSDISAAIWMQYICNIYMQYNVLVRVVNKTNEMCKPIFMLVNCHWLVFIIFFKLPIYCAL